MRVTSCNGTVHDADVHTTAYEHVETLIGGIMQRIKRAIVGKQYDGYVRKRCDGQWVPEHRSTKRATTCAACLRLAVPNQ